MGYSAEIMKQLCDLTVELTKLRQQECKHLMVENVAPEILGKLIEVVYPLHVLEEKPHSSKATRQQVLQEARDAITAWIKPGDLGGNGWDKNAKRNGMILAVNIIDKLMDDGSKER